MLGVLRSHECHGDSSRARAASTPDAVDVVFRLRRELVVDHHLNVLDVQAPRSYIRGDQDRRTPALEVGQHAFPLSLLLVAVDRVASYLPRECAGQAVASAFGGAEDEDSRSGSEGIDRLDQLVVSVEWRVENDYPLLDGGVGCQLFVGRADGDLMRRCKRW